MKAETYSGSVRSSFRAARFRSFRNCGSMWLNTFAAAGGNTLFVNLELIRYIKM
jgi:hypothetical protein